MATLEERKQAAVRVEASLRDYAEQFGLWSRDRLPPKLDMVFADFFMFGADTKSKVPLEFLRDSVRDNPSSGLAHYMLFCCVASCGQDNPDEGMEALDRALELGCSYISVVDGKVQLEPFIQGDRQ